MGLDNCVLPNILHWEQDTEHFHHPKQSARNNCFLFLWLWIKYFHTCIFHAWLPLLNIMFFEPHSCCHIYQLLALSLLLSGIYSISSAYPQFIYPFPKWSTSRLYPELGYYEYSCCENGWANVAICGHLWPHDYISLGKYPKGEFLGHWVNWCLTF